MTGLRITPYPERSRPRRTLLLLVTLSVAAFLAWAAVAELDEVAIGEGKVIPASRGQIIQSLEGGIVAELLVREGDVVQAGQKLATLDPIQARASVEETSVRIVALNARAARLQAEMDNRSDVTFPAAVEQAQPVALRERQLFRINRQAHQDNVTHLRRQVQLAEDELRMATPLLATGAANEAEVLRLKQKIAELSTRLSATQSEYQVALKADFAKTMADLEPLLKVQDGRADQLKRTVLHSPTHGIVKDVRISTLGGVVSAGGVLMEVIPLGDKLSVETRLSPRDIAFIHPGQETTVKITAYDSAIFGTLAGRVERVSPDTIEDQVDRRVYYYRAYVETDSNHLETADGVRHPILPGMIATTEIRTGRKTVMSYLVKPLNRAAEALRER